MSPRKGQTRSRESCPATSSASHAADTLRGPSPERTAVPTPLRSERGARPSPSPTACLLTYWEHTSCSEQTWGANANCLLTRAKPTNRCPDTGAAANSLSGRRRQEEAGKAARRKSECGAGAARSLVGPRPVTTLCGAVCY